MRGSILPFRNAWAPCIAAIAIILPFSAQSQDSLDLSQYEKAIEESGVVTIERFVEIEKDAEAAFQNGNCEVAIPKIQEYYNHANFLANIISAGLEPFYSASRDDRDKVLNDSTLISKLIAAERYSNELKKKRHIGWVMEAECLLKLNRNEEATVRLQRALDFISPSEKNLWEKSRKMLWDIIGYAGK